MTAENREQGRASLWEARPCLLFREIFGGSPLHPGGWRPQPAHYVLMGTCPAIAVKMNCSARRICPQTCAPAIPEVRRRTRAKQITRNRLSSRTIPENIAWSPWRSCWAWSGPGRRRGPSCTPARRAAKRVQLSSKQKIAVFPVFIGRLRSHNPFAEFLISVDTGSQNCLNVFSQ